ncbi:hypothetical protein APT89_15220 [Enterobacter sp. 50588862]|uniref:hypothetical protein n=2 Tax=Enterobacteriaceae TaxID=543 RepID=UPI00073C6DE8|nr:hypothetical protein APT89_15220 [Enterobacter sp. 50588862]
MRNLDLQKKLEQIVGIKLFQRVAFIRRHLFFTHLRHMRDMPYRLSVHQPVQSHSLQKRSRKMKMRLLFAAGGALACSTEFNFKRNEGKANEVQVNTVAQFYFHRDGTGSIPPIFAAVTRA